MHHLTSFLKALASFLSTALIVPGVLMAVWYIPGFPRYAANSVWRLPDTWSERMDDVATALWQMSHLLLPGTLVLTVTYALAIGLCRLGAPKVLVSMLSAFLLGWAALHAMLFIVLGLYVPMNIVGLGVSVVGSLLVGWWLPNAYEPGCAALSAVRGVASHIREQLA